MRSNHRSKKLTPLREKNKMIQRTTLAPAITHTRQLSIEELKILNLPLILQGDFVIIERSLNDWKLKTPITISLKKILETKEKGLVDYIIRSCLNDRPSIIPYIFENRSLVNLPVISYVTAQVHTEAALLTQ